LIDGFATGIKGLECQFTDGLCDWLNDTNSWLLGDYNDVSFGKPIEASLSGGYVYVGEDNVNHFHQLVSPIIEEDVGPFCFSFGYYMFGSSVGQLSLRLIDDNGSKSQWIEVDDDVWKRQGSQFDDWSIGKYHFDPKKKVKVRIAFVATTPNIAIGPIKVTPGSCDYEDFCDFEDLSSCFWTIEPDYRSNFAWYISDGKSRDSVKVVDTTTLTDSGKYLRTPNDGQKDSKSILATNVKMSSNNAKCLTFNLAKPHQDSDLVEVSISRGNQSDTEFIWTSSSIKAESKWLPIEID
ncbi:MAM and LDL-receptor class A domain-containing protein 1-like, partial [Panonychus citri]|uniref:MAM and LDL-receptor class A domain-containing protein 1-like n=1 Tax=Panonychus citri TaxID=50023 RepID=UPI0023079366